jgi:hypothetical protein
MADGRSQSVYLGSSTRSKEGGISMATADGTGTIVRASSSLKMTGYVLDQESLEKIDGISKELVAGADTKCTYEMRCSSATSGGQVFSFSTLDNLLPRLAAEASRVENLSLRYSSGRTAGINAVFNSDGLVRTKAFSHLPDLQFDLDRLARQIRECDQQYSWPVRTFVLSRLPRRLVRISIGFLFVFLLFGLGFYFYARSVGVNIDPSLIPPGETIANRVEEAIKSNDVNQKLNILLMHNLYGFTNVKDILKQWRTAIAWISISLAVAIICAFALRLFAGLYPSAYFRFGAQEKAWSKLEHRREFWGIVVVIGFFVHIVAGIILGFFAK